MIPFTFHFIWMGRTFPFINRLAVESVYQTNPGASIKIHFQDPPKGNPDWDSLEKVSELVPLQPAALISRVTAREPFRSRLFQVYNAVASAYPAGKSNILRYLILLDEGGIYLDFDTITLRSFEPLLQEEGFIGEETVFKCDDDRIAGNPGLFFLPLAALFGFSYYGTRINARYFKDSAAWHRFNRTLMNLWGARKLNNAVLGCIPGNEFFRKALEAVPEMDPAMKYSLGPMLMNHTWEDVSAAAVRRCPESFFYFIPPSQTCRIFFGPAPEIPRDAYAVHWCSSNHKTLAAGLSRRHLSSRNGSLSLIRRLAAPLIGNG